MGLPQILPQVLEGDIVEADKRYVDLPALFRSLLLGMSDYEPRGA